MSTKTEAPKATRSAATNGKLTPVNRVINPHRIGWADNGPTKTDVYLDEWRTELIRMLKRPIKTGGVKSVQIEVGSDVERIVFQTPDPEVKIAITLERIV